MPRNLVDEEPAVRFIFTKKDFSAQKGTVSWRVFLPDKKNLEASVSRTQDLEDQDIWPLGDIVGQLSSRKPPNAGGEVGVGYVRRYKLDVKPSEPPARHAAIVGWPTEKDKQFSCAQQLRKHAVLKLR